MPDRELFSLFVILDMVGSFGEGSGWAHCLVEVSAATVAESVAGVPLSSTIPDVDPPTVNDTFGKSLELELCPLRDEGQTCRWRSLTNRIHR
jgi:hypothetical protein